MMGRNLLLLLGLGLLSGCAAIPEVRHAPTFHNPFPQLHRVAILPFYNLSSDPTVNQEAVARAYYQELQKIPGFEVIPPGVVIRFLEANRIEINQATDFQALAQQLGVDVLIRGAVTEYTPYYPPRMGLSVDWFAANPSFHPIPPGYGLPWGTSEEEYIPDSLVWEAEFALAREQLKTQTPLPAPGDPPGVQGIPAPPAAEAEFRQLQHAVDPLARSSRGSGAGEHAGDPAAAPGSGLPPPVDLPLDWPDPRGFIPPPPRPVRPQPWPQAEPIITHTRLYDGKNSDFTEQLANYYWFLDDARFGGWQSYLERSEDFIRFCCYLHITEILAARGGAGKTRVVWRWPIDRYEP